MMLTPVCVLTGDVCLCACCTTPGLSAVLCAVRAKQAWRSNVSVTMIAVLRVAVCCVLLE
jgi:hypothetical protein